MIMNKLVRTRVCTVTLRKSNHAQSNRGHEVINDRNTTLKAISFGLSVFRHMAFSLTVMRM